MVQKGQFLVQKRIFFCHMAFFEPKKQVGMPIP